MNKQGNAHIICLSAYPLSLKTLTLSCILLLPLFCFAAVGSAADQQAAVQAAEETGVAKAGEKIGSGDGRIHVIPSLSSASVKNGGRLKIKAVVKAIEGVKQVEATIAPSGEEEAKPVDTIVLQPASMNLGGVSAEGTVGLWQAEWEGHGLSEGYYTVVLRVTDRAGHVYTDRSLRFSDPIAGNNTPGSSVYPNGGLRRLDGEFFAQEKTLSCAVIDSAAGYAYFGTWTWPGQVVKVRLSDLTRVDRLTLNAGENVVQSAVIDPSAGYAYFGIGTSPGRVVKIRLSDFTRVGTLTLDSGEVNLACAVIDPSAGYAYFSSWVSGPNPGKVVKVALGAGDNPPTRVGAVTLGTFDNSPQCAVIDTSAGYAYFGVGAGSGKVAKVALGVGNNPPTHVTTLNLPVGDSYLESAVIDTVTTSPGYAYFGTHTSPGKVVKIRLSDFTRVDALTLSGGEDDLDCAVIDTSTSYSYFATRTNPAKVVKIRLSDFTRLGALTLPSAEAYPMCAVIDPASGNSYFGTNQDPGKVVKVANGVGDNLPTRVGALTLNSQERDTWCAVIDPSAGYAYFGTYYQPGKVVKIRLSGLTYVDAVTRPVATNEDMLRSAVIDPSGGYAYFGNDDISNPAHVMKIRLSDFTRVDGLTLSAGEADAVSAVIDVSAGYAYLGTYTSPGRVVKIRLSDFTRLGALTLSGGENNLRSAVIDPTAGYAYFGTYTSPGIVVKVALGAGDNLPTRVDALTLDSGEDNLRSAVIDPTAGYAYFGTDTTPGKVVKIRLSDFTRLGALTLDSGENSLYSGLIYTSAGYAWFGTGTSPGRVVKVALGDEFSSPTRVDAVTLNSGENNLYSGVIDPLTGYGYFGTYTDPGQVVQMGLSQQGFIKATKFAMSETGEVQDVRFYSHEATGTVRLALYDDATTKTLLWQSSAITNTATNDFVVAPISSGTPSSVQLNAGNYWLAWQVDTARNVPSYAAGSSGDGFFSLQSYGAFPAEITTGSLTTTDEVWTEYITYSYPGIVDWQRY